MEHTFFVLGLWIIGILAFLFLGLIGFAIFVGLEALTIVLRLGKNTIFHPVLIPFYTLITLAITNNQEDAMFVFFVFFIVDLFVWMLK